LKQAFTSQQTADAKLKEIQHDGNSAKEHLAAIQQQAERASKASVAAQSVLAVARANLKQAEQALAEFQHLDGASACRACGQPLTKEHFAQEQQHRQTAISAAQAGLTKAEAEAKATHEAETRACTERDAKQKLVEQLRDDYKDNHAQSKQAAIDIKRLTASLNERYAQLPEDYQQRIAPDLPSDWRKTTYPERDTLAALRDEVHSLKAARQRVRALEKTTADWANLKNSVRMVQEQRDQLHKELKATVPLTELRQRHHTLQAQEVTSKNSIKALKQSITKLEEAEKKHRTEVHGQQSAVQDFHARIRNAEEKQAVYQETIRDNLAKLPEAWRSPVAEAGLQKLSLWQSEQIALEQDGVRKRHQELQEARGGLQTLRDEARQCEEHLASYPEDHRVSVESVAVLQTEASGKLSIAEQAWLQAKQDLAKLEQQEQERAKYGAELLKAEELFTRYELLAKLFSREWLQSHLVKQAERQIVEYANAMLDRLSGGQLYMQLAANNDSEKNKALDLECYNRGTGGPPINVVFLSGSQRFRVAVSLALAIGQYANKARRPIESVIIDEGFGCLDRQGRQVMIQELQNLKDQLHCILLVSHQEEFAEAFADGYTFELRNGATQIRRYDR
jgi:DNA repair exonuclease SbcCD ATPase subunit